MMITRRLLIIGILTLLAGPVYLVAKGSYNRFLPDHGKVQFAGSMGFLSLGTGYSFLNQKIDAGLFYGMVPAFAGGDNLHCLVLKSTFSLYQKQLHDQWRIVPITFGLFLNYSFGDQFYIFLPESYPDGYFFFSTGLRYHLFAGAAAARTLSSPMGIIKTVGGYLEINTNDLYLMSYARNTRHFYFYEILRLGIGIKTSFRY
jgi:hypothetical protein